nr:hypothetical protein [Tanacetum cinerariifolium]
MLTRKWLMLNVNCQQFNVTYKRAKRLGKSGENDVNLMKRAQRDFEAQAEKDRTLMRLEKLRFLATSTKDLDDHDAYWIKKQNRLIKNKMRNDLGDEDGEDEYGSF